MASKPHLSPAILERVARDDWAMEIDLDDIVHEMDARLVFNPDGESCGLKTVTTALGLQRHVVFPSKADPFY